MRCLENYIGLKNCNLPDPESGIFVNMLPGINTELVDKIAAPEQINFKGVWDNIKARSFLRLKNDVIMKIQEKTDFNDIIFQTKNLIPLTTENKIVNSGNEYRGVYLRIPTSKYTEYYIDTLAVYSDSIVSTTMKVFDVNDGKELFTKDVDLEIGLNNISIDYSFVLRYSNMELFIGVDCSNFNSFESYQEQFCWYDNDYNCGISDSIRGERNYSLQIQPAKLNIGEDALYSNIHRTSSGYGITVASQIKCSIEVFICQNRKQLQNALFYLLGAEILFEKMSSPRLNVFTASNLEVSDYTRKEFEKRYSENLDRAIKTIPLEGEGYCFSCGEQMRVESTGSMP